MRKEVTVRNQQAVTSKRLSDSSENGAKLEVAMAVERTMTHIRDAVASKRAEALSKLTGGA